MPRRANESLFADEPAAEATPDAAAPLAERIRPRMLAEFVGQQHLVGEGRVLRRVIEGGGLLPSLILWGAPGTGKTTLARLLARRSGSRFVPLSAVFSGVKDLRAAIAEAREDKKRDRKSTRLNSSHRCISYAVFCLKKKKQPRIEAILVGDLIVGCQPSTFLACAKRGSVG